MTRTIALVVVGDELLAGARADANGPWLARRLFTEGLEVRSLSIVGDRRGEIEKAVRAAARTSDAVLLTGGLGPTADDVTREALADAAGVALTVDAGAMASIAAFLERRGFPVEGGRTRQAEVPRGAAWLENRSGTAPGLVVRVGETPVFAVPGVPREMRDMVETHVLPRLAALGGSERPVERIVPSAGIPEAEVGRRLSDLAARGDPALGFYPHEGEVEVVVRSRGEGALERARAVEEEVRRRLGPAAWPAGPLEREVVRLLAEAGERLTTAESMTGGLVARMLTSVPGASDVFPGGWVTYTDAWKAKALGVPPVLLRERGAVSSDVARRMAEGARAAAGTELALSVTGIAGPGDADGPGGARIPAGTFHVAVAREGAPATVRSHRIPLERTAVQRRAAVAVLDLVRRTLSGTLDEGEGRYSEGSG